MNEAWISTLLEGAITIFVFLPTIAYYFTIPEGLRKYAGLIHNKERVFVELFCLIGLLVSYIIIGNSNFVSAFIPFSYGTGFYIGDYIEAYVIITFGLLLSYSIYILLKNIILESRNYIEMISQGIVLEIQKKTKNSFSGIDKQLEDLVYIGIHAEQGIQTKSVIDAYGKLLMHWQTQEERKDKVIENEQIIFICDSLCETVTNSKEAGSRQNMEDVLSLYKNLLMFLSQESTPQNPLILGSTAWIIAQCTTKIGKLAFEKNTYGLMPNVISVLSFIPNSPSKLFKLGFLAIEKKQWKILVNIISKILDNTFYPSYYKENNFPIENLFGLIAVFWYKGETAKQFINKFLRNQGIRWGKRKLLAAKKYHYNQSNFYTVDQLTRLIEEKYKK